MITVHEFGVDLGASTVPSKGGPPIGLAHIPQTTTQVRVEDVEQSRSRTRRFSREDRVRMLQNAGIEDAIITRFARETNIILKSRKRAIETLEDSDDERDELEDKAAAPASHLCKRPRSPSAIQEQEEEREALALRRPRMIPTNYV
ncbi:TPA: hypothetical protein N0F65_010478 [Lagenidium giganteum]|uniref:Uncharacterized protein n=1 Tax=Lagenidium giganteum TaxID=4803 RepID=A0AAV2Z5K0_9STRA|nr:TPA: hypothetical protein N0F65_010478 [Lagenidium giganteum]